jgi:hypothetical protein
MNPLRWKREYQVACIAFCVVGGLAGLFFAWVDSLGHKLVITNAGGYGAQAWFFVWLKHPSQYWQWPLLGVVFVGLTFHAVMSVAVQSK